jgi:hypothetical protein
MPCTFSPQYGSSIPCSGYGTCVNTTNINYPQLCQCDWNTIAPSDIFDLRVDMSDLSLATDCVTPRLAIRIIAAIFLFAIVIRSYFDIQAIRLRIARGHAPKKFSDLFTVSVNRILMIECFITVPFLTAWVILKLATDQVVSTDIGVTVVMSVGVVSMAIGHGELQHQLFAALISGHFKKRVENIRLLRLNRSLHWGVICSYLFLCILPTLISLSFDKSLGPFNSGILTILIVRNMGMTIWQLCALGAAAITAQSVHHLVKTIGDLQGADTKAVLDFVKNDEKSIAKKNMVALAMYIAFSLPWLWPLQGIQMLLMGILACIGMMPGNTLYNTLKAANKTSNATSGAAGGNGSSTVKSSGKDHDGGNYTASFSGLSPSQVVVTTPHFDSNVGTFGGDGEQ